MNGKELWRKCQLLLITALATYPLVMLVLNRLGPQLLGYGWLFGAVYVLLSFFGIQVKGKLRMTAGIVLSAAFVAAAVILAPEGAWLAAGAAALLCSGLLLWSLQMGGWSAKQEVAVLWITLGVIAHFVGQLSVHADRVGGGEGLSRYAGGLSAALFGFVLLTMLSMNRNGLNVASGKRQSVPEVMRRKNALMIIALFVFALLAALLPSVLGGMSDMMIKAILWIVDLVRRLIPKAELQENGDIYGEIGTTAVGGGGEEQLLVLNPIVEKIALFVGALLSLLMLVFLLWQIYKGLRDGIAKLVNRLGKFADNVSEDYIDEVTDTRQELEAEKLEKKRRLARMPLREPKDLAPEEKIRFRYRRLLSKHPEWKPGSTARETLPKNAAALYERARYSAHSVSEEDAAAFTEGIKTV